MRRVVSALCVLFVSGSASAGEVRQPGADDGTWSKYDFVPGEKVLFFEDFSAKDKKAGPLERLVRPSARLDLQDRPDGRWLRCRPPCTFEVVLPEKLPERFSVDFDLYGPDGNGVDFAAVKPDGSLIEGGVTAHSSANTLACGNGGDDSASNEIDRIAGIDGTRPMHFSWSFDGAKVKGYAAHHAGLNATNLRMERTSRIRFEFPGGDDPTLIDDNVPVFVTNLRIASGGSPVSFEELSKKGRLALPGILFDSGSDRIRPESTPTLMAVAQMLADNPGLRLAIEGHTDNQGVATANQTLSEKRSAAVKAWLSARNKDLAGRLETAGFGQTKPVASNDTTEGRQANRRVEIVKQGAR